MSQHTNPPEPPAYEEIANFDPVLQERRPTYASSSWAMDHAPVEVTNRHDLYTVLMAVYDQIRVTTKDADAALVQLRNWNPTSGEDNSPMPTWLKGHIDAMVVVKLPLIVERMEYCGEKYAHFVREGKIKDRLFQPLKYSKLFWDNEMTSIERKVKDLKTDLAELDKIWIEKTEKWKLSG